MNAGIQATRRGGAWRLQVLPPEVLDPTDEERMRQSLAAGQAINLAGYRTLAGEGVWQLELTKAALDDGEIAMGLAAGFADRCVAAPGQTHLLRARAAHLSRRGVVRALQARGERVAGAWMDALSDRVQFLAASCAAAACWIGTVARTAFDNRQLPRGTQVALAVHGEWSNRTRHVLGLCRETSTSPVVLVLGRPRASLRHTARLWQGQPGLAAAVLVRPFSPWSALRSAGRALRLCAAGYRLAPRQFHRPRFSEQVAMAYRCFLGAASAHWWRHSGAPVRTVVYGHTGLADTTLLEEAQQRTGASTVHAVHGISSGLNFVGRSSVGLFRCVHDARWHEELGGYGACQAKSAQPPGPARGGRGMLFLSNHLHPMNPWFRAFGAEDELRALGQVAAAADLLGVPRGEVVWKPHPVFASLPAAVRESVLARVDALGLRSWPDGAPLSEAARFRIVLSTRSTAALDVLRLGILPVILENREVTHADALSNFPLQARDAGMLGSAIAALDRAGMPALMADCWRRVGPADVLRPGDCLAGAGR